MSIEMTLAAVEVDEEEAEEESREGSLTHALTCVMTMALRALSADIQRLRHSMRTDAKSSHQCLHRAYSTREDQPLLAGCGTCWSAHGNDTV